MKTGFLIMCAAPSPVFGHGWYCGEQVYVSECNKRVTEANELCLATAKAHVDGFDKILDQNTEAISVLRSGQKTIENVVGLMTQSNTKTVEINERMSMWIREDTKLLKQVCGEEGGRYARMYNDKSTVLTERINEHRVARENNIDIVMAGYDADVNHADMILLEEEKKVLARLELRILTNYADNHLLNVTGQNSSEVSRIVEEHQLAHLDGLVSAHDADIVEPDVKTVERPARRRRHTHQRRQPETGWTDEAERLLSIPCRLI